MTKRIIYLDNAATTCPKPDSVYAAQDEYSRRAANPGRGAHRMALDSARSLFETRTMLAEFLGIKHAERLIFTPGCTHSINMALKGLAWNAGDTVVVSAMEHNAVMRPLKELERTHSVRTIVVPYAKRGIIDMHPFITTLLDVRPRLCIFSEASNVTGELIDVNAIATICGAHKVPLMVDAAQTAGRSLSRIDELGISLWCASGHKGLFGLPGAGLLYVAPDVELSPLVVGGTGSRSEEFEMPQAYPDHLEAGTLPGPAIAALGAGVRWLQDHGVKTISDAEQKLTKRFLDWAQRTEVVNVFGNRHDAPGTSIVSFNMPSVSCDQVAAMLDSRFYIAVRTGLHCAPSAHRALGTAETGLVRASFGCFNTTDDIDALCQALETIRSEVRVGNP